MKLYTEEQVKDLNYWKNNAEEDYLTTPISVLRYISELEKLTPIELPSHRDIMERANQQVDKTKDNYFVGFAACSEYYEQILRQLLMIKTNGTYTSQVDTNGIRN
jgi:hypothetical protein